MAAIRLLSMAADFLKGDLENPVTPAGLGKIKRRDRNAGEQRFKFL